MAVTRDPELEGFKTAIDLRAYAASLGYALDKHESWRGSSVMRHAGSDDKIVIKRDHDRHFVYFSVRDERDNGSIIDFAMRKRGLNLGQVRKELRPWTGKPASELPLFPALPVTAKNRLEVEASFQRMEDARRHPYLEGARGLPAALLAKERFAGRIRIDRYGNAVFPHFDLVGLCGYEIKNQGYTGFARGGEKGLWLSRREDGDGRVILAESAIDALSHAALFPALATRYASIGGQANARQPGLIGAMVRHLPEGAEVIAAMDGDEEGEKLAGLVAAAVAGAGREDIQVRFHRPEQAKDWNDVLRGSRPSFPTALSRPEV